MKYSNRHYASALLALAGTKKDLSLVAKNLFLFLQKKGERNRIHGILREIERTEREELGITRVVIESVSPQKAVLKKEITNIVGDAFFEEKITPELIAGVQIIINDELRIDASAKKHMNALFANTR